VFAEMSFVFLPETHKSFLSRFDGKNSKKKRE